MYIQFRLYLLVGLLLMLFSLTMAVTPKESLSSFETVHTSNAAVLNRLGLTPLQISDGHHKKRLAGPEPPRLNLQTRHHQPYSRRHGHRDSHVYIVKLPASPPFYTVTKPHKSINDDKIIKTGPNLPVGFRGNGKPAKIYHWNLPIVKKVTEKKRLQLNQLKIDQTRKKLEDVKMQQQMSSLRTMLDKFYSLDMTNKNYDHVINNKLQSRQKTPATKRIRNNDKILNYSDNDSVKFDLTKKSGSDVPNKTYRFKDNLSMHRIRLTNELHDSRNTTPKIKKHRKKAAMSYYAPISTKIGSNNIHKNFSGNGKPKAFYIMEKSRNPVYYHPLLP